MHTRPPRLTRTLEFVAAAILARGGEVYPPASMLPSHDTTAGQAMYSPWVLRIYDAYVLGLSCSLAWRCPSRRILAQYDRLVGRRHLDVGVGTGFYLDRCHFPTATPEITLLDLNPSSLAYATRRIARYAPRAVRRDAFEPLPLTECFDYFLSAPLPPGDHGREGPSRRPARLSAR